MIRLWDSHFEGKLRLRQRERVGRDAIIEASVQQLAQLFGSEAGRPRATLYKDWASDPLTATADDREAGGHPISRGLASVPGKWNNRIWLAGSEAGRRDAGYLAGAVEAAEYAVMQIMNKLEAAS